MPGGLHPHPNADSSLPQFSVELLGRSIAVIQLLFAALTRFLIQKCNFLKARVIIYSYNHHVRLPSPEPAVIDKPQSTGVNPSVETVSNSQTCRSMNFSFSNFLFSFRMKLGW